MTTIGNDYVLGSSRDELGRLDDQAVYYQMATLDALR